MCECTCTTPETPDTPPLPEPPEDETQTLSRVWRESFLTFIPDDDSRDHLRAVGQLFGELCAEGYMAFNNRQEPSRNSQLRHWEGACRELQQAISALRDEVECFQQERSSLEGHAYIMDMFQVTKDLEALAERLTPPPEYIT